MTYIKSALDFFSASLYVKKDADVDRAKHPIRLMRFSFIAFAG